MKKRYQRRGIKEEVSKKNSGERRGRNQIATNSKIMIVRHTCSERFALAFLCVVFALMPNGKTKSSGAAE
jgi:hypothetical protein